jgi:hypothetical protein
MPRDEVGTWAREALLRMEADRVCATPVLVPGEEWDVWHTQCSELAKLQGSVPDTDR